MRSFLLFAVALAGLAASPVAAREPLDLECAVKSAPQGVGAAELRNFLISEGIETGEESHPDAALYTAVTTCADRLGLSESQTVTYFGFVLSRVMVDAVEKRLGELGLDTAQVLTVIGENGGSIPLHPDDWSDRQDAEVMQMLDSTGLPFEDGTPLMALFGGWIGMARSGEDYRLQLVP